MCTHVYIRDFERVWRLGSGLHVCDQTKQGLKGPAAGWKREKTSGGGYSKRGILSWRRFGWGGGLESDGRQQGSSSPLGS